ncbi:hypothetical protein BU25DRAFT_195634 [Macroventuria anomochaeta]|uniref:Uncharacterized protein n=1 Tax=Macroventuria anomochaeta TaxID=301207 RepID=A0ACB6SEH0_9PLEO|nr:uncharacterized protein BU25DRAFT_195634 [Macroventuria anomochaeta]KAF2631733.1 hypothetical protein BU25DRAFT_195634 [Macroventuria anomochaeta]
MWAVAFRNFAGNHAFQTLIMLSSRNRTETNLSCGSLEACSALSLYQELPCVEIETTHLIDQTHPADGLHLNQTSSVARVDLYSGSRKPDLVDEDEADACLSLRSTFGMHFSNTCQRFKERSATDSTGIGFLRACRGVSQHRLLSSRKAVSGVFEL